MNDSNSPEINSLSRIEILGFMGTTAVILLIIAQIWRYFGSINLIPLVFSFSALIYGILIAGVILLASWILGKVWHRYQRSSAEYLDLIISPLVIPDLIWVGLLPALSEELLFRGVMIPAFGYDLVSIVISSALFGILHMSDRGKWDYALWAGIIGMILGYSAYITGNLLIPIIAHACTNLTSSLLWKLHKNNQY